MIEQERGGSIINLSSVVGVRIYKNRAGHCQAKAALISLTQELAVELAPYNIRVNCVAPSFTRTEATRDIWGSPEKEKAICAIIPLNRWAEPIDVACPILFLASDASNYITGQTIVIDGGMITPAQSSAAMDGDIALYEKYKHG